MKPPESEVHRAILDSTTDMIWSVDSETFSLLSFNRSLKVHYLQHRGIRLRRGMRQERLSANQNDLNLWQGFYRRAISEGPYTTEFALSPDTTPLQLTFNPLKRRGKVFGISVLGRDIAELKQAENAPGEGESNFRMLAESVPQLVWMCTPDGLNIYFNQNWVRYTGLTLEESYGRGWNTPFHPDDKQPAWNAWNHAVETGDTYSIECRLRRLDGTYRWFLTRGVPMRDAAGNIVKWFGTCTDIDDLKRVEQLQHEYEKVVESTGELIAVVDRNYHITLANSTYLKYHGLKREDVVGASLARVLGEEFFAHEIKPRMDECFQGKAIDFESRYAYPKLGERTLQVSYFPIEGHHGVDKVAFILDDITERKKTEITIRQSEARLKEAEHIAHIGSSSWDVTTNTTTWSDELYRITGWDPRRPAPTHQERASLYSQESWVRLDRAVQRSLATGEPYDLELEVVRPDGTRRQVYAQGAAIRGEEGGVVRLNGTLQDITERKQAEQELWRVNRALRTLSDCNKALVRAKGEPDLLHRICEILVRASGYRMAWVGFAEHDEGKSVRPVAQAGFEQGYLETANISWADTERGQGPTGRAIRLGKPQASRNMLTDPSFALWREEAVKRGYASSITLPLLLEGKVLGALMVYAEEPDAFDSAEEALLAELAEDVAYGIRTLRARAERQRAEEALQHEKAFTEFIIDSLPDIFYVVDSRGRYIRRNKNAKEKLGYSDEETLAMNPLASVEEEQRPLLASKIQEALTTGGATGEFNLLTRDGRKIPHILTATRAVIGDKVYLIGVGVDVTEQRRAQEALLEERYLLHSLMDNLPDLIFFKDRESRFTRVNKAVAQVLGSGDPAQVVGKTDFDFLPAKSAEEFRRVEEEIIKTGQPLVGKEEKGVWPGGSEFWLLTTKMPLRDAEGNIIGIFGIAHDITQNKRAEEALNAERHLLHTLMDNLPDKIYFKDLEGHFTRINLAHAKTFGLSHPSQVVGKTDFDFHGADHSKQAYRDEQEIIRTGQPLIDKEERETWTDGHVSWVSTTKMPLRDARGNTIGTFGVSRDITERKRVEESLRESEERFRATFENAGIGIALVDMQGHPFKSNPALQQMLGYSEEELGHMPFTEFTHTDDRELDWQLYCELTAGKREMYELEKRFLKKDGGVVWGLLTVTLIKDKQWRQQYTVAMLQDITEHKRTEQAVHESGEKFRSLVSNIPDVVWTLDANLRFVFISKNIERISGFSVEEIDQHGAELYLASLHPDDADKVKDGLRALFAEGRPFDVECRVRHKNGNWKWVHDRAVSTYEKGGIRYADGLLSDITERKQAEEALRESEERYRSVVTAMAEGIIVQDASGAIIACNQSAQRILGLSEKQLLGRASIDPRWGAIHEDGSPFPGELHPAMVALRTGETQSTVCMGVHNPDGMVTWITINAQPIWGSNQQVPSAVVTSFADITERKQAEEALSRSEERFRSLVENATVGIYRTTPEGRILTANPALVGMLGFQDVEELSLRNLEEDGFEPSYPRAVFRERLEQDSEVRGLEEAWKRQDGSVIFVRESARAIRNKDGKVLWYDGIVEDITENKLAEAKLHASETRYRRLFEASQDGILILNADTGEIDDVNPSLIELLGFTEAEILGKKLRDIGPLRDIVLSKVSFAELQSKGFIRYEDLPLETRDGRRINVEFVSNVYLANEKKVIQCNIRDITERRRAEAEHVRLVTAIEQSAEAVVITNPDGNIEYVNPAFTRITGYDREEALGQNPRILKSGNQDPEFYQQMWEAILRGQSWHGELTNRRKDGGLYTEQMTITPVRDEYGKLTHFIATKQDVTERRSLEGQLQQASKMEAVGRLAGGVAHDFNNLLTVINGYSEILLERSSSDQKASDYLKEINEAGARAASLTRQLLAFSRRQVLTPQVLDLNAVVANLEKMLRRLIGEDVQLSTLLDPALGQIKADPGQIEQVLMNLAVNARDAMPSGGHLTLETRNVELDEEYARKHPTVKPGPHVMVGVSDTGMGMTPETQARLFEPFFTTKELGKGTGLGLATVYGIVKQSGGSIWVYSELGHGTVFKIYFPLVGERAEGSELPTTAKDSAAGTETILMVEDEEGVRSLVRLALVAGGYNVLETDSAEKALAVCANHPGPIHLLLTDVIMPEMSGPEVASKVAALRPGIRVLYMSGYTDDAVLHHGIVSQDMSFIQKPFSPLALRKKIREVLEGK